jgi:Domain of unknown function (DUF4277)
MGQVRVERLDHLGWLAPVLQDLGLLEVINARLVPEHQAVITPGEALAGMLLHGLGFAHRPVSVPPQLLANKPRERWSREGLGAEMCNRFQLGRTPEEAYA